MNRTFTDEAWADYQYWAKTDKKQLKRINMLIKDIDRHPFEGIGKPELLKANLKGYWSRRIDTEHRIVYSVESNGVVYVSFSMWKLAFDFGAKLNWVMLQATYLDKFIATRVRHVLNGYLILISGRQTFRLLGKYRCSFCPKQALG